MNCVMRTTESCKVWKAFRKSYAPGKYHLYYILTFHLQTFISILERPVKFNQTANQEEMSGGGYLVLLIKTKQTRL